jgi:hypothetical protein
LLRRIYGQGFFSNVFSGAKSVASGTYSGAKTAYNVGKAVTKGTYGVAKGTYNVGKAVAKGTYNVGKAAAKGTYNVGKAATKAGVNLGTSAYQRGAQIYQQHLPSRQQIASAAQTVKHIYQETPGSFYPRAALAAAPYTAKKVLALPFQAVGSVAKAGAKGTVVTPFKGAVAGAKSAAKSIASDFTSYTSGISRDAQSYLNKNLPESIRPNPPVEPPKEGLYKRTVNWGEQEFGKKNLPKFKAGLLGATGIAGIAAASALGLGGALGGIVGGVTSLVKKKKEEEEQQQQPKTSA